MRIGAHDAGFAAKAGISQSVARDFYRADKRRDTIRKAIRKVRNGNGSRSTAAQTGREFQMSDTNIAPPAPASAPPAQARSTGEVVIDQTPASAPKPVGPQAPDAPVGDLEGGKGRPPSRREAIQKAFERANVEEQPEHKKVVKRGMGDNNPPETMEKEKGEKPEAKKPE